jgi:Undecaprenyl-phosphate galactose phosphotransferase WbaP
MTDEHHPRLASPARTARSDDHPESAATTTQSVEAAPGLHLVRDPRPSDPTVSPAVHPQPGHSQLTRRTYFAKRAFDVVGALALLLVLAPLMLIIIVLIRIEGQPVLFWHTRIGRNGQTFRCVKFRTMVRDAEQMLQRVLKERPDLRDEWTKAFKLRQDPRVTRTGRVLRLTSLDELPQLWNVLRGDMSLVGPRPIVRAELLRYGRYASRYLAVKPGLTGLWQINGRNDTTYRRRVAMDTFYVRHQSLWLDFCVLVATPAAVLQRNGAY